MKTSVLLANRPRLMRQLVQSTLADQQDIEVIGEVSEDDQILSYVEQAHPDILVISRDDSGRMRELCGALLRRHPGLKIIAVAPEQKSTVYYWATLQIHSRDVEASEEGILNLVRGQLQTIEEQS